MTYKPKTRIVSTGIYRGVKYMIREIDLDQAELIGSIPTKWFTAYIELPSCTDEDSLDCHGGCTFCSSEWPESFEEVKENCKIFGWDYNHLIDCHNPPTESRVLQDIKDTINWFKINILSIGLKEEKMTKLKPCPWCKCKLSIEIAIYGLWGSEDMYQIVHPENDCILSEFTSWCTDDIEELIEEWNKGVKE